MNPIHIYNPWAVFTFLETASWLDFLYAVLEKWDTFFEGIFSVVKLVYVISLLFTSEMASLYHGNAFKRLYFSLSCEHSLRILRYFIIGAGLAQWYIAGLRAGRSGVRIPIEAGNYSLHHRVQTGSGAHPPPIQWVPGVISLGVKRPGRKADHSPPSSAEVKNAWSYTSTPAYAFMAWCSVT
jgi:hypothetical protein